MNWGKGNNQTFKGLLDIGSEMAFGDPKCHCDLPVNVGANGCEEINGVLAQVYLTVGPVGP